MPLPDHRSVLRLALVALCLITAGCGGDGGPADEDQIATAVRLASTSDKVKESCETAVTTRFVREVYGGVAACRKENKPDPKDKTVDKSTVSQTRVKDDAATTALEVRSRWRHDRQRPRRAHQAERRLEARSLRLGLAALAVHRLPKLEDAPKGSAACFERATRGLSSSALRRNGNALVGGRLDDVNGPILQCLVGKTLGRDALEQGIEEGLREEGDFSEARLACVKRRLRSTVTDDEIASITSEHDLSPSLTRKMSRALLSC